MPERDITEKHFKPWILAFLGNDERKLISV